MDVLEGTARYFDMATNVRSIKCMNLSKKESYDIGGASGVILEKHNNSE
ncbi:hypothetical protein NRP93_002355 [Clostridium botulinum]|nr:hypothetical protein [Clostridium botulinum]